MDELRPIPDMSEQTKEVLKILEAARDRVWKRIEAHVSAQMETPLDDDISAAIDGSYLSLIAVDCLIELAQSGYDLLSQVNDKEGALKTVSE